MRIKISVNNSQNLKNINIQDVEFLDKYDEGLPKIYFKCPKKFEDSFIGKTVIFHDRKGRELFRSPGIRLEFRYYESDFGPNARQNKVEFSANFIEFENLGLLSKPYLRKILRKCCNAKVAAPPTKKSPPKMRDIKKWRENLRFMDIVKSKIFKAVLYRIMRTFRYICKQICPNFITIPTRSTAPT